MLHKKDFWERVGSSFVAAILATIVVGGATLLFTKLAQPRPIRALLSSVVVPNPFYPNRQYLGSQVSSLLESQFGFKDSVKAWWDFGNEATLEVGSIVIKNVSQDRGGAVEIKSPTAMLYSPVVSNTEPVSRVIIPSIDPGDTVSVSYVGRTASKISMVYDGHLLEYGTAKYPDVFDASFWNSFGPVGGFVIAVFASLITTFPLRRLRLLVNKYVTRQ